MANASKVAEIFQQASVAFGRLAQLTLDLKIAQSHTNDATQKNTSKWSDQEINQLREAISRFGNDLGKISESIQTKTFAQVKQKVKSKAFQDAGVDGIQRVHQDSSESQILPIPGSDDSLRRKLNAETTPDDPSPPTIKRVRLNEATDSSYPTLQPQANQAKSNRMATPGVPKSLQEGAIFVRTPGRVTNTEVKPRQDHQIDSPDESSNRRIPYPNESEGSSHRNYGSTCPTSTQNSVFEPAKSSPSRYEEYEDSSDGGGDAEFDDFDEQSDCDEDCEDET